MKYLLRSSENSLNFWQLGVTLGGSIGVPGMFFGHNLAQKYGAGTAISSIIIGDLIIWTFALAVVAMSIEARVNTIELLKEHLGKWGKFAALICLSLAFLGWYILQENISSSAADFVLRNYTTPPDDMRIRIGAGIGFLSALLATGGLRMVKKVCVLFTPFFLAYLFYSCITGYSRVPLANTWGFSFPAITTAILGGLPVIIYLPTVYQYARSKVDALLGLIVMVCLWMILECGSIWVDFSHIAVLKENNNFLGMITAFLSFFFIIFALICNNMANIYLVVSSWGRVIANIPDGKSYAAGGLIATMIYTFVQITQPMLFFVNIMSGLLANLAIVLLLAFLGKKVIKHKPIVPIHRINNFCWMMGCITTLILQVQMPSDNLTPLIGGVLTTLFTFAIVLFIEETTWAIQEL